MVLRDNLLDMIRSTLVKEYGRRIMSKRFVGVTTPINLLKMLRETWGLRMIVSRRCFLDVDAHMTLNGFTTAESCENENMDMHNFFG